MERVSHLRTHQSKSAQLLQSFVEQSLEPLPSLFINVLRAIGPLLLYMIPSSSYASLEAAPVYTDAFQAPYRSTEAAEVMSLECISTSHPLPFQAALER